MGRKFSRFSRVFHCFLTLLVLTLFPLARSASAQTGATASIVGRVTDESNAVLPGVTVTATSPALQVPQVSDVTSATGEYRLTTLPVGTYIVEFALSGFRTGTPRRRATECRLHGEVGHRHGRRSAGGDGYRVWCLPGG